MSFQKLPDNLGMIFVPECTQECRKNKCIDCFSCQWCSNERCRLCKEKLLQVEKKKTGQKNK